MSRINMRLEAVLLVVFPLLLFVIFFILINLHADERPLRHIPSKNEVMDDPDIRASLTRLSKACPNCEAYLTIGVQYGPGDSLEEIPTAFLFVKDYGYNVRVCQIETGKKLRLIAVLLPGKILDLDFKKFAKKLVD